MTQDISYFEIGYIDESYFVRLADAESSISTSASISATCGVIKQAQVAITSAFTTNIQARPIRNDESLLSTSAILAATPSRIRNNNIAVASVFSVATSASRVFHVSASESAVFNITAANRRTRNSQAAVTAAFSSTLTAKVTANEVINLSTTASLTATAIRSIRITGDSQVQGQIITQTGAVLQATTYPDYSKLTLAQPV